jgi:hypothetical protein
VTAREAATPYRKLLVAMQAIVADDAAAFARTLAGWPALATAVLDVGASRDCTTPYFFDTISHYVYTGDTALHAACPSVPRQS